MFIIDRLGKFLELQNVLLQMLYPWISTVVIFQEWVMLQGESKVPK